MTSQGRHQPTTPSNKVNKMFVFRYTNDIYLPIFLGMVKSYGVIFDLILKTFPNSSVALASWIPASMTTLALAMAPFTSALCQRYNCRNVTFIGSLLCFIGITLSSFASSVEILFVTFGLLTGIGIGMSTTPGIILVARYFDKRRGIANAFCLSGNYIFYKFYGKVLPEIKKSIYFCAKNMLVV